MTGVAKEDAGIKTVRQVFERFKVDPRWSTWSGRGFTWWPHRLAQRVWADEPVEEDGLVRARVNAQTDLWPMSDREWEAFGEVFAETSRFATMSGYLRQNGVVRLHTSAWVHDENQPSTSRVFRLAAIMQAAKAEAQAKGAAKAGLRPHSTAHPATGPRPHPDEILAAVAAIPERGRSSPRLMKEEIDRVGGLLRGEGVTTNWEEIGLLTGFPFGLDGAPAAGADCTYLTISAGEVHPQLGFGLLMRLQLRGEPSLDGRPVRPLDLNRLEWERWCPAHFLGSWCSGPSGGPPVFVSFVPNVLYRPNLLLELVMSSGARFSWLSETLLREPEDADQSLEGCELSE